MLTYPRVCEISISIPWDKNLVQITHLDSPSKRVKNPRRKNSVSTGATSVVEEISVTFFGFRRLKIA